MVDFTNPFTGMNSDKMLTKEELIRAIRFNIAAEYEAVQLYMQLHDSIDDEFSKAVLKDIANEEKEHAGEFFELLRHLAPDEENYYNEGKKEVEEIYKKVKKEIS